ncbi:MAG: phosphatidylserine decarboxylase [Candidatus Woesearchaeota archaeon]
MVKEGRKIVFLFSVFSFLLWILSFKYKFLLLVVIIFSTLTLLLINFFRDPKREIRKDKTVLYSPADGKIFEVLEKEDAYCIKIFMSIFNVHIQRAPIDCSIKSIVYKPGKFLPAAKKDSSELNEKNIIEVETEDKDRLLITQIAGILARRIVCWVKENDFVQQGEKLGVILLGSQVDFEFPKNKYRILVEKGQKVFAGKSVVAIKIK